MKTVHICFLWHMHQPYYTDPVAGFASMPWVRLHAIKAYYDMAWMMERFPSIKATFNFTPSLLTQLQELSSGLVGDLFLHYAQRPAADLTPSERAFIVRHFFAANWGTMVRPFPRYHELLVKRGLDVTRQPLDRLAAQFTTQELLDLQVWHNLTWFGYGMVARHPRLNALREKGRGFTEEEKQEVLAFQRQAVGDIIPMYRRLAESGQVELTTSPFYHPILPLLIDTEFARRSRPEAHLPSRFQAPADAESQIRNAVALHREVFGAAPDGLWPSEGSVCPELIPMLHQAGLKWTATDEGVLARSLGHWNRQDALYQPYLTGPPGQDLRIVFRDRELSDAFGFVYSKLTPESAVEDVMQRLRGIAAHQLGEEAMVPVILDGENPWEHYYDGGERFLSCLYTELAKASPATNDRAHLSADTISRALEAHPHPRRLDHLHSGSWINQDFKIWIGHAEDNRAWDLLKLTRDHLAEVAGTLSPEQAHGAWEELYAAEGSDWCWWFGDDFETDYKPEFDSLFRMHLRNVHTRAGLPVPDALNEPLIGTHETRPFLPPVSLLTPTLDGRVSDFFEWHGAGTIDPAPPLGAMWKSQKFFTGIYFGFSVDALFLRLDPGAAFADEASGLAVESHIATAHRSYKLAFPFTPTPQTFTLYGSENGNAWTEIGRYGTISCRKILELAVPFKDLRLQAGQEFRLSVAVLQNGAEVERYPRQQPVSLTVPDDNYEATTWRV
ncbi:MAG TPA: glycoside hydrolase family 57 protein [Nitrospiraceae bacterium]